MVEYFRLYGNHSSSAHCRQSSRRWHNCMLLHSSKTLCTKQLPGISVCCLLFVFVEGEGEAEEVFQTGILNCPAPVFCRKFHSLVWSFYFWFRLNILAKSPHKWYCAHRVKTLKWTKKLLGNLGDYMLSHATLWVIWFYRVFTAFFIFELFYSSLNGGILKVMSRVLIFRTANIVPLASIWPVRSQKIIFHPPRQHNFSIPDCMCAMVGCLWILFLNFVRTGYWFSH